MIAMHWEKLVYKNGIGTKESRESFMKRMKLMLCGIALLLLVPVIGYQAYDGDTALKAETVIDDSPLGEKIVDIAIGSQGETFYALTDGGRVYAWGNNYHGQAGTAENKSSSDPILKKPIKINGLVGIKEIYAGGGAYRFDSTAESGGIAFAVDSNGILYGWGDNRLGSIGATTNSAFYEPQIIPFSDSIRKISIGLKASAILSNDGDVYVSGKNQSGMLGVGSEVAINQISNGFKKISTDINDVQLPFIKNVEV